MMTDHTHDAARHCWVEGADGHPDFPLQNLPLGIFSPHGAPPRAGTAIGDRILDLKAAAEAGLLDAAPEAAAALGEATLNRLLALDAGARRTLRAALFDLLAAEAGAAARTRAAGLLHRAEACTLHLPAEVGDYSDFFAGIHHARNGGLLLRPDTPLMPNYKYVPVAYHGRASSIRASGWPVQRPNGQRKRADEAAPSFGPSRNLDFELELGIWIGPGNTLGEPIPIAEAHAHVAGICLLNDWSARDIQGWEYQPLGPFLAKSFLTTVSPWIVTAEALRPFRIPMPPRPEGDPAPLPHLWAEPDQMAGGLDLDLEVTLASPEMRRRGLEPLVLSRSNARHLYWTMAQMVAHQTSNGCNLRPGDLLGSGTISGPGDDSLGSLLEITRGGRRAIDLPTGEHRRFLEDGDEVVLRARARRAGHAPIGLGECRGVVQAARAG